MDLIKTLAATKDAFHLGVASAENLATLSINATAFCLRHFQNTTEIQADLNNPEEIIAELGCTASDLSILNIKHQTSILRIILCVSTTILCWGNQPLLKTWNFAYGIFVILTIACLLLQSDFLKGNEKYSLAVMLVLCFSSNRNGRQNRLRLDVDEGLFNLVLFSLIVFMSYIISTHLIYGIEELTYLEINDVTPGGKATWFMNVVMEYSILMVVGAFALFYFDEVRKRALLLFMSCITIYHALFQLPSQKDFWLDGSMRQNCAMGMLVCMLAGALTPSFSRFVVKK